MEVGSSDLSKTQVSVEDSVSEVQSNSSKDTTDQIDHIADVKGDLYN